MLAYIPYMDPMGKYIYIRNLTGQLSHDRQSFSNVNMSIMNYV